LYSKEVVLTDVDVKQTWRGRQVGKEVPLHAMEALGGRGVAPTHS
jgi:hypothetical protein